MRERRKNKQRAIDDTPELRNHQRKLNYLRQRRKFRQMQISLIRLRALFRIIATLIIFLVLIKITSLSQWYLNKDVFNFYPNHSLEISGNEIVTTKQIMAALKPVNLPKKQIYLLKTNSIEKALLQLPPIKKVYIRRFWFPARLKIIINEREPVLAISPSPKVMPVAVFTNDDIIIDRQYLPLPESKPCYLILTYIDYRKWSVNHVNYLVYMSKLLETASNEKVMYIDLRNPDDVFVQLKDVRLRLGELNKSVFKRAKRISSVLAEAIKLKNEIDYIDLRWNNSVSIKLRNKTNVNPDNSSISDTPDEDVPNDSINQGKSFNNIR